MECNPNVMVIVDREESREVDPVVQRLDADVLMEEVKVPEEKMEV